MRDKNIKDVNNHILNNNDKILNNNEEEEEEEEEESIEFSQIDFILIQTIDSRCKDYKINQERV